MITVCSLNNHRCNRKSFSFRTSLSRALVEQLGPDRHKSRYPVRLPNNINNILGVTTFLLPTDVFFWLSPYKNMVLIPNREELAPVTKKIYSAHVENKVYYAMVDQKCIVLTFVFEVALYLMVPWSFFRNFTADIWQLNASSCYRQGNNIIKC